MNLHEYQAKSLFKSYSLPVSKSELIFSIDDIEKAITNLKAKEYVVKAQVHAGGRGKAGGVLLTKSSEEIREFCKKWLGKNLVTYQTDAKGQPVSCILLEECTDIEKELYLGLVIDRTTRSIALIASPEGGVDIETVATNSPEKIFKVFLNSSNQIKKEEVDSLSMGLNLNNSQKSDFSLMLKNLINLFTEKDFSLIEINPLVIDREGKLKCLDGKINVDSNALYRQDLIKEMRDESQEDILELKASKWGLNYVTLDGSVGCMVNGAGLAMGTMDIIKLAGGFPANFLDVGGAVNKESVTEAFKIIISDSKVKSILINVFGGIVRCDVVAEGIISAIKDVGIKIPVVVRLKGNNSEIAKSLLEKSKLNIFTELDLSKAAKKAVELSE